VGVIGGSGLYQFIGELAEKGHEMVHTPYGVVECSTGIWSGVPVVFLPRHGEGHGYPPHKVKFKANIWALNELGVRQAVGTCAVGTLNDKLKPGTITVPDQLIDLTKEVLQHVPAQRRDVSALTLGKCPSCNQPVPIR
jgi:5'-methylthioadenosine phosphorylase